MAVDRPHAESDTQYWSNDYWLTHCEGFRVDSPDGRIGIVEYVLTDHAGEPTGLVVRAGLFGTKLTGIPRDLIVEIRPRDSRIVVRAATGIAA